jgi:hypothetical protein
MSAPYLSIVAASRNDNHGGNALQRMRLFVNGLIAQANRHQLPVELVMVEWNPPENQPLLQDVLPKPQAGDLLTITYVIVPPAVHQQYKRSSEIPLFQMIAKNVGIRRAKGEFILCSNIDLLFSDPLFRLLASRELMHDAFYRANRCDVPNEINPEWQVEEQLNWCAKNVIRRLGMDARFTNINLEQLGMNHRSDYQKWVLDKLAIALQLLWAPEKIRYYQLDSFACGDFTLMSREAWFKIRGYAELDLYSIHVDTLGLIAAASMGYRQHIFPREACTYHLDHEQGWSAMTPVDKIRFLVERPGLDYGLVVEAGLLALQRKEPLPLNSANWGFADQEFAEYSFPRSESAAH